MTNNEANEFIKELFNSLKNRYPTNYQSIKGSVFVFDYVHLLYYRCHEVNQNCGGSYIDFSDKIKIEPFINKFNWKEINSPSEKDDWKKTERNNRKIALNNLYVKKERNILLLFQNITHIIENKLFF